MALISPGSPLGPGGPIGPSGPSNPAGPGKPGYPSVPGGPGGPGSPEIPNQHSKPSKKSFKISYLVTQYRNILHLFCQVELISFVLGHLLDGATVKSGCFVAFEAATE